MKDTEIVEILEDGTIHLFDMDICNQVADETIEQLIDKEGTVLNYDFSATVFSIFIKSVHILTNAGWNTEDLINEVIDHSEADDADDFVDDNADDVD